MQNTVDFKNEIRKTLEILTYNVENPIVEIRIPNDFGVVSGYYDNTHFEKLAADVKKYDGKYNIYVTLNEVNPSLIARSVNKLREGKGKIVTTSDNDIINRKWIMIDCDPVRPSGISSTDFEKNESKNLLKNIVSNLSAENFPDPVICDSGNGYHMLYATDIQNNKDNIALVKSFLTKLSEKFDNEFVKVDIGVYNAARITKLYGTMSVKGESIEDRPHRRSKIIQVPDKIEIVPGELIQNFITAAAPQKEPEKKTEKKTENKSTNNNIFDIQKWIEKYGIDIERIENKVDGTQYDLTNCCFNPEHKKSDIFQFLNGALKFKCFHNSCANKSWDDVKQLFEPKKAYDNPKIATPTSKVQKSPPKKLVIASAVELLAKDIKPLEYIVDGFIGDQGVYILAGASKMGKSWLAMDMSLCISEGKPFFNRLTKQTNVLYVDLESGERGLKSRIEKLSVDMPFPDRWFYTNELEPIDEGFQEQIEDAITEHDVKFIIIDVVVKIRSNRPRTMTEYKHDYYDLSILKHIANKYQVTFLLIIHLTKMNYDDPFNKITGSTGIMGASDGAIILDRNRLTGEANLFMTGREIQQQTYSIAWNEATLKWEYIAKKEELEKIMDNKDYESNPIVQTIRLIMLETNFWKMHVADLNIEMHKRLDLNLFDRISIPDNAHKTGDMLRKYTYKLQQEGINLKIGKRISKGYPLSIYR